MTKTEYARLMESASAVSEADEFAKSFDPKPGVDYGWVEEYAQGRYDAAVKAFDALDAKATSVINYSTSGAGLFTLGSLAGLAAAKVPPVVVGFAVPSIVCAIGAVILAAIARRPMAVYPPPSGADALRIANSTEDEAAAKGDMAAYWHRATVALRETNRAKSWDVSVATVLMTFAVGLLLPPLAASLFLVSHPHPPTITLVAP